MKRNRMPNKEAVSEYLKVNVKFNTEAPVTMLGLSVIFDIIAFYVSWPHWWLIAIIAVLVALFIGIYFKNKSLIERDCKFCVFYLGIMAVKFAISCFLLSVPTLFLRLRMWWIWMILSIVLIAVIGAVSFYVGVNISPNSKKRGSAMLIASMSTFGAIIGVSISRMISDEGAKLVVMGAIALILSAIMIVAASGMLAKAYLIEWLEEQDE